MDKNDEQLDKEITLIAKAMCNAPVEILVMALMTALDKILYDGKASTRTQQHKCAVGAMELLKLVFKQAAEEQKKEVAEKKSEGRAKEFADAAIARAIKAAKEEVAKRAGRKETPDTKGFIVPGSDSLN